jgi:hypothetical protein
MSCDNGSAPVSYTQQGSVVDVESVTVPAGTFTALKFQSTITWTDADGTNRTQTITNWRDTATLYTLKQQISIAVTGTLPTNGYPVSRSHRIAKHFAAAPLRGATSGTRHVALRDDLVAARFRATKRACYCAAIGLTTKPQERPNDLEDFRIIEDLSERRARPAEPVADHRQQYVRSAGARTAPARAR